MDGCYYGNTKICQASKIFWVVNNSNKHSHSLCSISYQFILLCNFLAPDSLHNASSPVPSQSGYIFAPCLSKEDFCFCFWFFFTEWTENMNLILVHTDSFIRSSQKCCVTIIIPILLSLLKRVGCGHSEKFCNLPMLHSHIPWHWWDLNPDQLHSKVMVFHCSLLVSN